MELGMGRLKGWGEAFTDDEALAAECAETAEELPLFVLFSREMAIEEGCRPGVACGLYLPSLDFSARSVSSLVFF